MSVSILGAVLAGAFAFRPHPNQLPDASSWAMQIAAKERYAALDSGFSPAIEHLVILEMERRRDSLSMMAQTTIGTAPQLVGMGIEDAQWISEVDSLDAFMRSAPQGPMLSIGNLAASRMYERLGDTRAALHAVRRRDFFYGRSPFYSTYLRDEARLAEKAGDSRGAAEALRLYLALRGKPEPALQRDVAEARAAFGRTNRPAESR